MIPVTRLNHAVLFVSDVARSVDFYTQTFGFVEVSREMGGRAAFLRSPRGDNHHDLGLFAAPPGAPHPRTGTITGLYHLAWQVDHVEDLLAARETLARAGALTGESDHGVSLSLYGVDPDGNEFEIVWMLPREDWGANAERATTGPLDLQGALARYGG